KTTSDLARDCFAPVVCAVRCCAPPGKFIDAGGRFRLPGLLKRGASEESRPDGVSQMDIASIVPINIAPGVLRGDRPVGINERLVEAVKQPSNANGQVVAGPSHRLRQTP